MKAKRNSPKEMPWTQAAPIRTTFLELLWELTRLTTDDALVLAAVKDIFQTYSVRLAHSVAPVRLVGAQVPIRSTMKGGLSPRPSRSA